MRDPLRDHTHRQEVIDALRSSRGLTAEEAASLMPRPQLEPRATRDLSDTDPHFVHRIVGLDDGITRHLREGVPLAMERLRRTNRHQWKALRIKYCQEKVQTDKAIAVWGGRGVHWARRQVERGLDQLVAWLWCADGTPRWPTGEAE